MRLRNRLFIKSLLLLPLLSLAFSEKETVPPGPDDADADDFNDFGGGGGGGGYIVRDEIKDWWHEFKKKFNYPLYCIVLASTSDIEVARFTENFRSELAAISDKDCCFIYFRDLNKRKDFIPFQYSEHAKVIYPLARYFDLDLSSIPCFVFFEQFDSGEHICISLKLLTDQEIISLVRKIFNHLHNDKRSNPLDKLKHFQHERRLQASSHTLLQNLLGLGKEALLELLKSLVTLHK
jgi:hypothetical protein